MKKLFCALIVLVLLGLPGSARAFEVDDLIALTAMPVVVAEAAELPNVPTGELMTVVTTLNNAAVRPTQFVEVVRYAPVALVAPAEPRFVTYVTTQYERGIVGEPLALAIADQYPVYGVREIHVVNPPVLTYVERRTYLPEVVVSQFRPVEVDPLALVAMPLAVAAVADLTDIPRSDLVSLVLSLNQAMVPAPQFVEVVRYSPVVLVDRQEAPVFLSFVRTEIDRGVVGRPLAIALADRIDFDDDVIINPPRIIAEPVVVTRVEHLRSHPHGGPPGQLKKARDLQTGAEVVHGTWASSSRPKRVAKPKMVYVDDTDHRTRPVRRTVVIPHERKQDRGVVAVERPRGNSGGKGHVAKGNSGHSGNAGKGNSGGGKAKGKGKGKG